MGRQILKGGLLIDPTAGREEPVDVVLEDGRITAIARPHDGAISCASGDEVVDLSGQWLVPGLVDLNCALREPGYEQQETIETGLRAAAVGGITAVCASPETSPVTDNAAVVIQVLERARAAGQARLIPVGAASQGLEGIALAPFGELREHGCLAVTQGSEPIKDARLMRRTLEYAKAFDVVVINQALDSTLRGICDEGIWSTRLGLPATPACAELIAIERDLAMADLTGSRLHLTKVSTAVGLEAVVRAKAKGIPVTCDVAIHHLHLTAESLRGYDPHYKVWPPLRRPEDVEALRQGVASGAVDAIVSDHRPVQAQDKAHEFMDAAFGISGLETLLALTLRLVESGSLTAAQAIRALASGPREVLGLDDGGLAVGGVADLTAIDPGASWILDEGSMASKGRNTPFLGQVFMGRATRTVVAGKTVFTA